MALILKSLIQRSLDNFQLSQYEIESNDLHLKKHLRHFKTASRACFLLRKEMILSLSQFFFFFVGKQKFYMHQLQVSLSFSLLALMLVLISKSPIENWNLPPRSPRASHLLFLN